MHVLTFVTPSYTSICNAAVNRADADRANYMLLTVHCFVSLYACTQGVPALVLTDQGAFKGVSVMVKLSSLE
jgi:hypothetical protein